jgi:site-specific recombinase XerD
MTQLRQRYLEDLRLRNYTEKTQQCYVYCVSAFARHFNKSPKELGPKHIREYQLYLLEKKKCSWAYFNQTVCALRFLYRTTLGKEWVVSRIPFPRRERKLPEVLSPSEVVQFLAAIRKLKYRTALTTAYAAGLRLSEIRNLHVSDIDSKRMTIRVRQAKGHKDRYVMLSPKLLVLLRQYWETQRPTTWLFPGRTKHEQLNEGVLQYVARRARHRSGLKKKITTHTLRHCFATHLLEAGTDIRTIQLLMGHATLQTTVQYIHISQGAVAAVRSPFDALPEPRL